MVITVEFGLSTPLYEMVKEAHLLAVKLNCLVKFRFERDRFKYEWLTISCVDNLEQELSRLKAAGYKLGWLG